MLRKKPEAVTGVLNFAALPGGLLLGGKSCEKGSGAAAALFFGLEDRMKRNDISCTVLCYPVIVKKGSLKYYKNIKSCAGTPYSPAGGSRRQPKNC